MGHPWTITAFSKSAARKGFRVQVSSLAKSFGNCRDKSGRMRVFASRGHHLGTTGAFRWPQDTGRQVYHGCWRGKTTLDEMFLGLAVVLVR